MPGLGEVTDARARRISEDNGSYTLHGRVTKSRPFEVWEADLADVPRTREEPRQNKYILCVVDVHSKHAMVRVVDRNEPKAVAEALQSIIEENVPQHTCLNAIRTDASIEFFNRYCRERVYKPFGINHYRCQKEPGASAVGCFIHTMTRSMTRYVSRHPNTTQAQLLAMVQDFANPVTRAYINDGFHDLDENK